ncbi:MAG TPA: hypothetical protein PKW97_09040 [Syntrophorhabdus sp.]|nr:hypothetical protein [Syntrophorhabdus sp.]
MKFGRYIANNVNLLNIILVVCVIVMSMAALSPYFYPQVRYNPPVVKIHPASEENQSEATAASPSLSDYMVIAEQNLFHPDRKIPLEKQDAQQMPKPELILYGTLVTESMSVAYVEDKKNPKTSPGRGKRQNVMKKGDSVGGFVLKEIESDRIVLARGDETMVVHLNQGDKPRISDIPSAPAVSAKPVPGAVPPPKIGTPMPVRPTTPHSAATPTPSPKTDPMRAPSPMPRGSRFSPQK